MEKITSLQNPRIKNVILLSKTRERRAQQLMVIEGFREITMALNFGYEIREVFYAPEINMSASVKELIGQIPVKYEVSKPVFEKIAYREHSDGLIALGVPKYRKPDDLNLSENPLILIAESVEKPGNLGALLRTADAAALDAVFVCDPHTDIFNPNVIRSSLGCIFSQNVITCTTYEAIQFLKKRNIRTYAAALTASNFYQDADFKTPCAIVMGTEAEGLSASWLDGADKQIKIPMQGKVDSLNVSASAAILIFEAKRQRNFK